MNRVGTAIGSMAITLGIMADSEPNWTEKWSTYVLIAGALYTAFQIISGWLKDRRVKKMQLLERIDARLNDGNGLMDRLDKLTQANAAATVVVVDQLLTHDLETHSKELLAETKGKLQQTLIMTSSDNLKASQGQKL